MYEKHQWLSIYIGMPPLNGFCHDGPSACVLSVFSAFMCCLQAAEMAATVLQLVLTYAGSPTNQLMLAAQLLPLSSSMPQLLAGRLQLVVAASTWPRVQQVASWLRRYGDMVTSLQLNAVVDCCDQDARKANAALQDALRSTATKFKVCQTCGRAHNCAGIVSTQRLYPTIQQASGKGGEAKY